MGDHELLHLLTAEELPARALFADVPPGGGQALRVLEALRVHVQRARQQQRAQRLRRHLGPAPDFGTTNAEPCEETLSLCFALFGREKKKPPCGTLSTSKTPPQPLGSAVTFVARCGSSAARAARTGGQSSPQSPKISSAAASSASLGAASPPRSSCLLHPRPFQWKADKDNYSVV